MRAKFAWTMSGLILLAGCASTGGGGGAKPSAPSAAPAASAAFRTTDFAWSKAPGKGAIDGQLAYSPKGVAYGCAGSTVVLTPETPWVRSRMMVLYQSTDVARLPAAEVRGRTPPERSQDYSSFVRRTTCDATNRFSFTGLPDGAWFVITVAKAVNPAQGQDIAIMRRVTIKNGGTAQARL